MKLMMFKIIFNQQTLQFNVSTYNVLALWYLRASGSELEFMTHNRSRTQVLGKASNSLCFNFLIHKMGIYHYQSHKVARKNN